MQKMFTIQNLLKIVQKHLTAIHSTSKRRELAETFRFIPGVRMSSTVMKTL